ncbi:MAG: type II toxin-antitoxin system VapB family antitoxin [Parvularculaceae bacterium]
MSLNIKNPETHALAVELAQKLGSTLTEAVTVALKDRLARERRETQIAERKAQLTRSSRRIADMIGPGGLPDHDALLYDDRGLPK